MSPRPVPAHLLQQAVNAVTEAHGSFQFAGKRIGVDASTLKHRYNLAIKAGIKPSVTVQSRESELLYEIAELKARIAGAEREGLDEKLVRSKIVGLAESEPSVPDWVLSDRIPASKPGVPTLFASDWHWGEVVDSSQISGVNEYNLEIAHRRARTMIEVAVDLLKRHMVNPKYPGIVFPLGGDLLSGDIHEELSETNAAPMMPVFVDLWGVLIWCIETLAHEFGHVFVPIVTGNHPRMTRKPRSKGRAYTNFDWLIGQMLEGHFVRNGDKRVSFLIPTGPDVLYAVCGHKYLLTHGDQFRGGDGMIGALGPIIRGDHKKRSRNAQINQEYDTLLLGHWHQLIQMQRLIVNGSLKGYDEYAHAGNFPYEPPRQALWLTHPQHGITFQMPINVERKRVIKAEAWVSLKAA